MNTHALLEDLRSQDVRLSWIKLHDPNTGRWHELRAADCFPWLVEEADRRRKKRTTLRNQRNEKRRSEGKLKEHERATR